MPCLCECMGGAALRGRRWSVGAGVERGPTLWCWEKVAPYAKTTQVTGKTVQDGESGRPSSVSVGSAAVGSANRRSKIFEKKKSDIWTKRVQTCLFSSLSLVPRHYSAVTTYIGLAMIIHLEMI